MADRRSKFKPTAGWKMQLSRYRSVGLYPARARCGKAWLIQAKNLGIETSMGLSDEAMLALFTLYRRSNASTRDEQKANAHLIAAAPDMFEALGELVSFIKAHVPILEGNPLIEDADAALAKALNTISGEMHR